MVLAEEGQQPALAATEFPRGLGQSAPPGEDSSRNRLRVHGLVAETENDPHGKPSGKADQRHARSQRRQPNPRRHASFVAAPGHLPRRAEPGADGEQNDPDRDFQRRRQLGDKQSGDSQCRHRHGRRGRQLEHPPDGQRAATKEKRGAGIGRRQWGVRQERGIGEAERQRQPRSLGAKQSSAPDIHEQGDKHAPDGGERSGQQEHPPRRVAVLEEIRPRQRHHVAQGPAGLLERRQRPAGQHERNGTPALRQIAVLRMQTVVVQLPIRRSADDVQGLVGRSGFPQRGSDGHAPPDSERHRHEDRFCSAMADKKGPS